MNWFKTLFEGGPPRPAVIAALLFGLLAATHSSQAEGGFLQISNGYFWDSAAQDYFIPRGVAYQIWNPPVGANQSLEQVDYDLLEFVKMHANSVRAELTWGQVETNQGQYYWTNADHLVSQAEKLGLKLFIIIGYQYPPAWLPAQLRGIDNQGLRPDVVQCLAASSPSNALNCLHPSAASALQATNSPATLAQVLNCLVTGAQAGGVSNILDLLQSTLTPDELNANLPYLISDVINYEDPQARAAYQQYIGAVTFRYKDSPAIGGWILGNEYAYFDLWEDRTLYPVHRFLGYDSLGQQNFQSFLRSLYHTNIAALNTNWQASYSDFSSVPMPLEYPPDRHFPGFQDLIQWRKQSIANYVAVGAVAARQNDPNHLCTYSMIGAIFNGDDANYTCEDAKTIVSICAAAGAPLDFWSINNYAEALTGSEQRSAAFGIEKYQAESGLPVMISETGYSSTENLFDYDSGTGYSYSGARQAKALPSTMWESLLCGAIGVHFFTWNDRDLFTTNYFYRERGFGIAYENRLPKPQVYDNMVAMFRQLDNIRVEQLLGGSTNPPPDVQLFWSTNSDMVWPRANQENLMIWGALKRLGFQLRIIDDAAFEQGAYTNAPALLLSRCFQMNPRHLDQLATNVIPAGIHLHAQADLPGQFDAYCRTNSNWSGLMQTLFGMDVTQASAPVDLCVTNDCYSPINLQGVVDLGPITNGFLVDLQTWKMWQNIVPLSAQVILSDFGFPNLTNGQVNCPYLDPTPYPALLVNATGPGRGKTAVNPFALGDTFNWRGTEASQWDTRYAVLHAIYRDYFGLLPKISLSGTNSEHVLPSYRLCANGSVLIALLNEDTNAAILTLSAPDLLTGRKVEDLSFGGVLTSNSNGTLTYTNQGDDCVILYAYTTAGSQDNSLINPNPNKLWFQDAPLSVWPCASPSQVSVGYDTSDTNLSLVVTLEQTSPHPGIYGQSSVTNIAGKGVVLVQVPAQDADPNNPNYISSHEGAQYVFHARLLKGGVPVTDLALPVRLLFGVYPTQPLPADPVAGHTYTNTLVWEELPSYASGDAVPLDRATLWDSASAGQEHYNIVLELMNSGGSIVASNAFLTSEGTGSNTFSIAVPARASGSFTWNAYVQTATNVLSHDVQESFEGYELGAMWPGPNVPTNVNFLAPWRSFTYPATNIWLNEGIQLIGSDGSQSAFIVATNPASVTVATFGMFYQYTNDWALPTDHTRWTNYVFSYDFMESHGYACSVEMQIKDTNSNWIQFTNLYGGSAVWFTVKASLNEFEPPPPGVTGPFDANHVSFIFLNIRMLTPDVVYVGSFDNIHFTGPETNLGGGEVISIYTSANDSVWLSIESNAEGVSVSWTGGGILQSAAEANGPWLDITNATSPFLVKPLPGRQFFRWHQ